jgi:peroxin-7
MVLNVWNTEKKENCLIEKYEHHTEFVVGLDFNLENDEGK